MIHCSGNRPLHTLHASGTDKGSTGVLGARTMCFLLQSCLQQNPFLSDDGSCLVEVKIINQFLTPQVSVYYILYGILNATVAPHRRPLLV